MRRPTGRLDGERHFRYTAESPRQREGCLSAPNLLSETGMTRNEALKAGDYEAPESRRTAVAGMGTPCATGCIRASRRLSFAGFVSIGMIFGRQNAA